MRAFTRCLALTLLSWPGAGLAQPASPPTPRGAAPQTSTQGTASPSTGAPSSHVTSSPGVSGAPAGTAGAKTAGAPSVPVDPEGVRGLAPSMALLNQGDVALIARDFAGARNLYQRAIKEDPQQARAHLRMAQLHVNQGEVEDAAAVLETALRFGGTDLQLKAQIYFMQAMVAERGPKIELASASWNAFVTFAQAASDPQAPSAASTKDLATPAPPVPAQAAPAEAGGARNGAPAPGGAGANDTDADVAPVEGSGTTLASDVEDAIGRASGAPLVFSGTVAERKRMLLARQKAVAGAEEVKVRIAKRYAEAQAEARE